MSADFVAVPGCRHDVLGHNLKAIGLLRALATCAAPDHRAPEAEGSWDLGSATLRVRSEKYQTEDVLVRFLAEHYCASHPISAWNTENRGRTARCISHSAGRR